MTSSSNPTNSNQCLSCGGQLLHAFTRLKGSNRAVATRNVNYGSRYHRDNRPLNITPTRAPVVPMIASYYDCRTCHTRHVMPVANIYK